MGKLQNYIQSSRGMKEERKARDMREKIKENKEKRGKKSQDKDEELSDEAFEKIGNYKIFIDKLIGEGTYGRVYKAKSTESNELFACKVIFKKKLQDLKMYREEYAKELEERFKTESEFHKKLSGQPHIVKLVDTIENKKAFYFVMEYCELDLSKIIRAKGTLSEEVALRYFTQMVEGYKSIYLNHAFHRDLKPENLLVKEDSIKISDFGFVKIFSEIDFDKQCRTGKNKLRTQSKVGSIKYMAPDVLSLSSQSSSSSTYNAQKSDIWSMGIILYKMLYGKEPYNGKDQQQMMKVISEKQLSFPDTAMISPEVIRNTNVSSEVKRLLRKMIQRKQDDRISFKKLQSKIRELNNSKQSDKKDKKIRGLEGDLGGYDSDIKNKNKKEQLLIIYNKIVLQLYRDAVNYASLRQIGFQNYYEITCKLMSLIHQKRTNYLEEEDEGQQVSEKIKQDISFYHNSFAIHIKNKAKLQEEDTLQKILLQIYEKIKDYEDYEFLMNEVLIFMINLLLLLSLELKFVEPNFVFIESTRLEKLKKGVILKEWQSTLKNIRKNLSGEEEEEEGKGDEQGKGKKEKKHKHHRQREDSEEKGQATEKEQKSHKKSRDKSRDKHKSKDKKSKKEDK